jgi:hypothetical protein
MGHLQSQGEVAEPAPLALVRGGARSADTAAAGPASSGAFAVAATGSPRAIAPARPPPAPPQVAGGISRRAGRDRPRVGPPAPASCRRRAFRRDGAVGRDPF